MFTIFHIEFFNYGSCRAARIDSYESHSTGWVEESHFGLELDKNETDGVEPFALSPEFTAQSFKALLLPPKSLKKRPKKKADSLTGKTDGNGYYVEGWSVMHAIFPPNR